ncbi:hypothetical protein [Vreelandella lutescens]|uniref:Uncharacterized protein n=1 Tax=Vreelandella lutescens TaxID=1602943 RepID=A0ABQ1NFE5_9GAMM|nr:hypothetical protein [Halomonas lutescens]GGC75105.1 hypothetical protein GCM10011382_01100 [Halomonas lutescens]
MQPTPFKALAAAICTLALSAPLAAQEEVRINGEVVERFNDLLVVDEGDRRLLIRPEGSSGERFQIGDDIMVEGRLEGDTVTASSLRHPESESSANAPRQGRVIAPDVADLQRQLSERRFGEMVELKRRDDVYRITSINEEGYDVRSYFSPEGELIEWHIKRPGHDRPHRDDSLSGLDQSDVENSLSEQGYRNAILADFKGRHMEWLAENDAEEQVVLHVDYRGDVYREKRLPAWPAE